MRVAFLYSWDWSHELEAYAAGRVPSHRLFGAAELRRLGFDVVTFHWGRFPRPLRKRQIWKIWQAFQLLVRQRSIECVVCTTEAPALPVLAFRSCRLLSRPVMVIAVGTLGEKYLNAQLASIRRALIRSADHVIVLAAEQIGAMTSELGIRKSRITFVPFGVDVDFFEPAAPPPPELDVISAGTNEGKDFPTLVAALDPSAVCLIVTDEDNAAKAAATPTDADVRIDHDVPIEQLRELYLSARKIVIPLRDVAFSSGQTVLLENLALGRPVIVTDVVAVRDYVDADVATIVPPGDVPAMRKALRSDLPPVCSKAVRHIRDRFTIERFADDLAGLCHQLTQTTSGGDSREEANP